VDLVIERLVDQKPQAHVLASRFMALKFTPVETGYGLAREKRASAVREWKENLLLRQLKGQGVGQLAEVLLLTELSTDTLEALKQERDRIASKYLGTNLEGKVQMLGLLGGYFGPGEIEAVLASRE